MIIVMILKSWFLVSTFRTTVTTASPTISINHLSPCTGFVTHVFIGQFIICWVINIFLHHTCIIYKILILRVGNVIIYAMLSTKFDNFWHTLFRKRLWTCCNRSVVAAYFWNVMLLFCSCIHCLLFLFFMISLTKTNFLTRFTCYWISGKALNWTS
ncbi:hypothetical protein V8G54_008655 [Vigna mungo]|uniref:Uncharacterized protein n=1 Tax=Vigna mungo TaxID=3915 RepID=A0AAQ3S9E6_VIGMU